MNFINLLKFIFLGFVQGFTEPIPVSSSGHLLIFQKLLSGNNLDVDFSLLATLTNFGSLVAIIILFRKEIGNLFKGFFGYLTTKKEQYKLLKQIKNPNRPCILFVYLLEQKVNLNELKYQKEEVENVYMLTKEEIEEL